MTSDGENHGDGDPHDKPVEEMTLGELLEKNREIRSIIAGIEPDRSEACIEIPVWAYRVQTELIQRMGEIHD